MQTIVYYPSNMESKIVAGARIARWLFKNLPANPHKTLLGGKQAKEFTPEKEYVLFIVNVPKTMIADIEKTEKLVENAKVVVWVQNDYSIWAPTSQTTGESIVTRAFTARIRKKKPTWVWSTCMHRVEKNPEDYAYVNWNALAHTPLEATGKRITSRILYYGAFREGRVKEFDRYMGHKNAAGHFLISAPKAAEGKFMERYNFTQENMVGVLNIPTDLTKYGVTLYMEDDLSHRQFHSPANRFYEALSANMAILVDHRAVGTLNKAGFEVPEFCITGDLDSAVTALNNHKKIRSWQEKNWNHDPIAKVSHEAALKKQLKQLVKGIV